MADVVISIPVGELFSSNYFLGPVWKFATCFGCSDDVEPIERVQSRRIVQCVTCQTCYLETMDRCSPLSMKWFLCPIATNTL
jgi:hypothetical protein